MYTCIIHVYLSLSLYIYIYIRNNLHVEINDFTYYRIGTTSAPSNMSEALAIKQGARSGMDWKNTQTTKPGRTRM